MEALNNMTYRQRPEANYSNLKILVDGTPANYQHALKNPIVATRPMEIGTIIHAIFLESKPFDALAIVPPSDAPKRPSSVQRNAKKPSAETLEAIAFWDSFNPSGLIVLDQGEKQDVEACVESLMSSKWLADVLADSDTEQDVYGDVDGVDCKGLLDVVNRSQTLVVDLKCNAQDIGPDQFKWAVKKRHYDLQQSLYSELLGVSQRPNWVWAVQQTEPPYLLALHQSNDFHYASGRAKLQTVIGKLKQCQESGKWPGYPDKPVELP
jgi:hypothetical protein